MGKIHLNSNHWAGILLLLMVIPGFIFSKKPVVYYKLTPQEMLTEAMAKKDVLTPDNIRDIIKKGEPLLVLVDLRPPKDYIIGHIDDAVNIPLPDLLEKKYVSFLHQKDKEVVLYADDEVKACAPWMLLKQLGYQHVKVMLGGYNYYITGKKMPPVVAGKCFDEYPKYDYASYFKENIRISQPPKVASKLVVPKRKKVATPSGGC
ncbi:MAG: hypothetical protein J7K46_02070 [Bacteroidales bacterium]|nr:hypothetical protein [Bacteroidales bacterium]